MRGTIQKKGKKWYAVVYDGVNPATGEYRRRWVQAGTRRGDAEKLLAALVKRAHLGETVVSEKLTLGQYLTERWLPIQEARLRKSSFDAYRRNIELHVVPGLGKRHLDQLTPEDIDMFYAALLEGGRKKRPGEKGPAKGLAPKTVHNIHVMLNKALSDAARKGTVVRNVVALADAPSLEARKRPEIKAWEIDQLVRFLDAISSHRMGPAFEFAANSGVHRGEVLGVRWRDIDLNAARVSVRQALVSVSYKVSISDVKTRTSRRTIDIEEDVVQVLRDWWKVRAEERDGVEPTPDDLVFVKADGTSPHPDVFSQLFDRTVAKLDVPDISLYDLRHTHATLLLKAGVNVKVVSERLGHANIAFTMHVYQHVLPACRPPRPTRSRCSFAASVLRHMPNTAQGSLTSMRLESFPTASCRAFAIRWSAPSMLLRWPPSREPQRVLARHLPGDQARVPSADILRFVNRRPCGRPAPAECRPER